MERFVGLIGAILLGLVVATAQERTPKSDDAAEKVLLDSERALYQAVAKSDKAAFQSLVAPEGSWSSPSGFIPMPLLGDTLDVFRLPTFGGQNLRVMWTENKNSALVVMEDRRRLVRASDASRERPGLDRVDETRREVDCGSSPGERRSEAAVAPGASRRLETAGACYSSGELLRRGIHEAGEAKRVCARPVWGNQDPIRTLPVASSPAMVPVIAQKRPRADAEYTRATPAALTTNAQASGERLPVRKEPGSPGSAGR